MRSLPAPPSSTFPAPHTFGPLRIGQSWDADWLTTSLQGGGLRPVQRRPGVETGDPVKSL